MLQKKSDEAKSHSVLAKDLYTSNLFRKAWIYAETLVKPDRIYILSALHHIVKPETPLGYYDYSLVGAQNSTKKRGRREWFNSSKMRMSICRMMKLSFSPGRIITSFLRLIWGTIYFHIEKPVAAELVKF